MQRHTPVRALYVAIAGAMALSGCAKSDGVTGVSDAPLAPVFVTQPASLLATAGSTALLIAIPSGTTPIGIQWYHNGTPVSGGTRDTLALAPVTDADAGTYFAIATNRAGSDTSRSVTVAIVPAVSPTAWRQSGGAGASFGRQYASTVQDESAVYVFASGIYTFNESAIVKSGGTSNADASRDRGLNAAVLAATNGHIYMDTSTVATDGAGATGLFATGPGSRVQAVGGSVTTSSPAAPLIGVSDGGTVVVTGSALTAAAADGIVAWARAGTDAAVAVTLGAGTTITTGTGVLVRAGNGASATVTLDGATLAGRAIADAASTLALAVRNGATWNGAMQGGSVTLDAASVWNVTAGSTVTALTGAAISGTTITNIAGAFSVTYDATLPANAALAGKVYALAGGGSLLPR